MSIVLQFYIIMQEKCSK